MFEVKIDLPEVLDAVKASLENQFPTILKTVGNDLLALVQRRIQQTGEGVYSSLSSRSTRKFGAYSHKYGKYKRAKRGFQTGFIDWTFDGDMWRNWGILEATNKYVDLGFSDPWEHEKSEYIEKANGIGFGLNESEIDIAKYIIKQQIRLLL